MPVSFLSPAQRDSYGQYLGDPNRLGFALQLTTVRFVGTFLDDPTAVPPAVLATMSRQLGIDTTTDLTGYRDGKWRFAHAAQIRTEHGYRDLADRAAGFSLTRWLYAQCWTGTERPSALFDRATTWMLAHKVLLPGATTLERFVAKLRHRVDVRVWRVLASGISPPQQRRLEDRTEMPTATATSRALKQSPAPDSWRRVACGGRARSSRSQARARASSEAVRSRMRRARKCTKSRRGCCPPSVSRPTTRRAGRCTRLELSHSAPHSVRNVAGSHCFRRAMLVHAPTPERR